MKYKIVFFGTPLVAAKTLSALIKSEHEILLVISLPDRAYGRKMLIQPSPVKQTALAAGVDVFQPNNINDVTSLEYLANINADLFLVVAYGKILSRSVLDLPRLGCYNLHYSLLPRLRGAAPIQFALLNGDKVSGVSLIKMNSAMDKGPVVCQASCMIEDGINFLQLEAKLCLLGIDILLKYLPDIAKLPCIPQDDEQATYTGLISKKDAMINWQSSSLDIYRRWQAFSPKPGIYSFYENRRVIFSIIKIADLDNFWRPLANSKPGSIELASGQIKIWCAKGAILVTHFKWEGKQQVKVEDFLRGLSFNNRAKFLNSAMESHF